MCECAVLDLVLIVVVFVVGCFEFFGLIIFFLFWLATHSEQIERASERTCERVLNIFYELVHCSSTQNIKVKERT